MSGSTGIAGTWPTMQASIPSHIIGATAGRARRLAGSEAIEIASNAFAISGAVASVAEIVTPAPSASSAAPAD